MCKVYDLLPYISSPIYTPSNYAALRKDGVSTGYESTTHFMRPRPKYTIEISGDMRYFSRMNTLMGVPVNCQCSRILFSR